MRIEEWEKYFRDLLGGVEGQVKRKEREEKERWGRRMKEEIRCVGGFKRQESSKDRRNSF